MVNVNEEPPEVVNVFRGQPRNYWFISVHTPHQGVRDLNEVEFVRTFPKTFSYMLERFGGREAGVVLFLIERRLGAL